MPESRRLLDDWLATYLKWTLPRSESPRSLILWAGLFTLASALKRRVYIPKTVLGNRVILPNIFVIYVGDPGVVRKTTTVGFAEDLMMDCKPINIAPSATSASKLVDIMAQTKDGAISVISGEFSSFIGTSKEAMYELLTDLFDGKIKHELATRGRGYEMIKNPCVNLLAATTPAWIGQQPIEHLVAGGFASRVIFIYESQVRQRKFFYNNLDWEWLRETEKMLKADLLRITQLKGEFQYDSPETMEWFEDWYRDTADKAETSSDERTRGYYQRRPAHVSKIAMLLSVASSDDLIITRAHLEASMLLLHEIEERMPRALSSVGSKLSQDIDEIGDFIKLYKGPCPEGKIFSRFYGRLVRKQVLEYLDTLCIMGEVEKITEGTGSGKKTLYRTPQRRSKVTLISSNGKRPLAHLSMNEDPDRASDFTVMPREDLIPQEPFEP